MILLDRSRVAAPEVLQSERARVLWKKAAEFYRRRPAERGQTRFDWNPPLYGHRQVREALRQLSFNKCAFCEIPLEYPSFDVELFRPWANALSLAGERAPDHYWWLVLEWRNLYPSCPACNRGKGTRFPVRGRRAPRETEWSQLAEEKALLLDPCAVGEENDPMRHLVFSEDGHVAAVQLGDLWTEEQKRYGWPTRGQVTIDTYSLNRPDLVADRRAAAALLRASLHNPTALENLLAPGEPYLAMKRQLLAALQRRHAARRDAAKRRRARLGQKSRETVIAQSSVEAPGQEEQKTYFARAVYVERVEIERVGGIEKLEFNFGGGGGTADGGAGWLMLLGENGVGKTSLLKGIALALGGPRRLERLLRAPSHAHLVTLFRPGGYVRVFLTSQTKPLEVRRQKDCLVHSGEAEGSKVILRGFGPSRWFPLTKTTKAESGDFVRVQNLFDPFAPLAPAEPFLFGLARGRWTELAKGIKDLLQLGAEGRLRRRAGQVMLRVPGTSRKPLRHPSSGYEAVLAMTCDLAHLLFRRWDDLHTAEGIVLLDEIDAHLHPRWKMRIVASLRRTFPRVQFLASTHEPLCLRGLRAGEILVLHRQEGQVMSLRPAQDVSELRVDQILTSRIFGLHTALDPALEEQWDRYYQLLSRHETARTPEDNEELARLMDMVGNRGILGSTRRDQLLYRLLDKRAARESARDDAATNEHWTADQIEAFWQKFESREGQP